ncbi:hypothetical protein AYO44_17640 [Planctomycetaceae bacterium SCGC AG-212-F19]|nr:hypothetical protein AYO44_17640 [Planctomycetaceae bacterium SCGC AG-212-F19]
MDAAGQAREAESAAYAKLLHPNGPVTTPLPDDIGLPGHTLLIEPILTSTADRVGALALAVRDGQQETLDPIRALLAICATIIAPHVAPRGGDPGVDEAALTEGLANLGELARPLTHLFNNFLNSLVLKVAVLEQQLPESYRPSLGQLRQQGTSVANYVKAFQQCRQQIEPIGARADVNRAVRAAVALARTNPGEATDSAMAVKLVLGNPLPSVVGTTGELRRCCFFLVVNAWRACRTRTVVVRTEQVGGNVQVQVEDEGPIVEPAQLGKLFELAGAVRPGTQPLELAACRSIIRRLGGRLRAENLPAGGLMITLELPITPK